MKSLRVLLIDVSKEHRNAFERISQPGESIKFHVTAATAKTAEPLIGHGSDHPHIVLFGSRVPAGAIVRLAKLIRCRMPSIPIFMLTEENEVRLSRRMRTAGVDDVLNVGEIETPLFLWSFTSLAEDTTLKKKAREYDILHNRLCEVSQLLRSIIHDINNPLSVVRLALYHLENPTLPSDKRETFFGLLASNFQRMEMRLGDLYAVKRRLDGDRAVRTKILSFRPSKPATKGK